MDRVIGRLAAVFRRSRGGNQPAASAISGSAIPPRRSAPASSSVPHPPALVVADGYVVAYGTRFAPVARVEEFVAAVPVQARIALRLPTIDYRAVKLTLMRWFDASEYGGSSPEYRAYYHAALVCAGCGWEFPGSYTMSLLGMFGEGTVVGGTSGFGKFGRTGKCTRCGSRESFLLYERIDPDGVDEEDLAALARLWREYALRWWSRSGRAKGICDECYADMRAGEGYFISTRLACESCVRDRLRGGLEKLRANPYRYGATELRRARPFRTG